MASRLRLIQQCWRLLCAAHPAHGVEKLDVQRASRWCELYAGREGGLYVLSTLELGRLARKLRGLAPRSRRTWVLALLEDEGGE